MTVSDSAAIRSPFTMTRDTISLVNMDLIQKLVTQASVESQLARRRNPMSATIRTTKRYVGPELHNGDQMTRAEFHRAYERTEEKFKAELIRGIVYVASPLTLGHGVNHLPLGTALFAYGSRTPGTQAADNATILLGDESEPQPDLFLRILPEYGGQSRTTRDDYVEGAPELIAEIANTSRSIDLHGKLEDYTQHGVREYLVLTLGEGRLRWFDLQNCKELRADSEGICRIRCFPGLWIDERAVIEKDFARLITVLDQGLATEEHARFVKQLANAHKPKRKRKR
jgi:Uma2 family endonuclease